MNIYFFCLRELCVWEELHSSPQSAESRDIQPAAQFLHSGRPAMQRGIIPATGAEDKHR